jgi:hypothetical protein
MFDVVIFTHRVCYPAQTLWFYRFQNFKLFGFTIIHFLAYLIKRLFQKHVMRTKFDIYVLFFFVKI